VKARRQAGVVRLRLNKPIQQKKPPRTELASHNVQVQRYMLCHSIREAVEGPREPSLPEAPGNEQPQVEQKEQRQETPGRNNRSL